MNYSEQNMLRQIVAGEAMDEDTAVSDSFVEAYALIDSVIREVNAAIEMDDIGSVDMNRVRMAEKAWFFTSGTAHGLAIDRPEHEEALEYMRKAISSLQASRDGGFQQKVYEMPRDMAIILKFDYDKALQAAETFFDRVRPPKKKWIDGARLETDKVKSGIRAYMREPGTGNPTTVGTCSDDEPGLVRSDGQYEPDGKSILANNASDVEDSSPWSDIVKLLSQDRISERGKGRDANGHWLDDDKTAKDKEFGEKRVPVCSTDSMISMIRQFCDDLRIDPEDFSPVTLDAVFSMDNGSYYIAKFYGGENGPGRFSKYLMIVKRVTKFLEDTFETKPWLINWKNDCLDDVWDIEIGFRDERALMSGDTRVRILNAIAGEVTKMGEEGAEDKLVDSLLKATKLAIMRTPEIVE